MQSGAGPRLPSCQLIRDEGELTTPLAPRDSNDGDGHHYSQTVTRAGDGKITQSVVGGCLWWLQRRLRGRGWWEGFMGLTGKQDRMSLAIIRFTS